MRIIRVDANVGHLYTYSSAAEAIFAATSTPRAKRSETDSGRIAGASMVGFAVSDEKVSLWLSNGWRLDLSVEGEKMGWQLVEARDRPVESRRDGSGVISLLWADGDRSTWDRTGLLESRLPFRLTMIFGGEMDVSVSFGRGGALQFLPLWSRSAEAFIVYFDELEPIRDKTTTRDQ
jgi:hypothetical protein